MLSCQLFFPTIKAAILGAGGIFVRACYLIICLLMLLPVSAAANDYRLGPNDIVRVTVFGEPDLSGDFKLDGAGVAALPLIGSVPLGNQSVREAEKAITAALKDGYLVDPKVSIEVATARPFFIMGEVRTPGSYNFSEGMTVLQAVALSGGFTYRANQREVLLVRGEAEEEARMTTRIMPGDVIHVKERFF